MTGDYSAADLCRILRLDASQLRACLRAALLPLPGAGPSCSYSFQNLVVLRTAKGLTDAGVSVARIRKVLECLVRQPGRAFSRHQLMDAAIGEGAVVLERTIDVHVKTLRRKLGAADLIETVRGVGYRFRESRE